MSNKTKFWTVWLSCLAGLVALIVFTVPTTKPRDVAPATPTEPPPVTTPTQEEPKALFNLGDKVTVDGLTTLSGETIVGTIVEVQVMSLWISVETGEGVVSRAYMVEFQVEGMPEPEQLRLPEIVIKRAQ